VKHAIVDRGHDARDGVLLLVGQPGFFERRAPCPLEVADAPSALGKNQIGDPRLPVGAGLRPRRFPAGEDLGDLASDRQPTRPTILRVRQHEHVGLNPTPALEAPPSWRILLPVPVVNVSSWCHSAPR